MASARPLGPTLLPSLSFSLVKFGGLFFFKLLIPAHCSLDGRESFNCSSKKCFFVLFCFFFDPLGEDFHLNVVSVQMFCLSRQNQVPSVVRDVSTAAVSWWTSEVFFCCDSNRVQKEACICIT